MTTQENQTVAGDNQPETTEIHNVNQFAGFLVGWHTKVLEGMNHLLTLPDGATFQVASPTDPEIARELVITGDAREAFKLGVNMAIMMAKNLPFQVEMEPDAAEVTPTREEVEGC